VGTFFAILKAVLGLFGFFKDEKLKQEGVELQAGRDAKVAADAQERMAEAVAKAPDTKAEVIDSLKRGDF
jgi:hypothetical protein